MVKLLATNSAQSEFVVKVQLLGKTLTICVCDFLKSVLQNVVNSKYTHNVNNTKLMFVTCSIVHALSETHCVTKDLQLLEHN